MTLNQLQEVHSGLLFYFIFIQVKKIKNEVINKCINVFFFFINIFFINIIKCKLFYLLSCKQNKDYWNAFYKKKIHF